MEDSSVADVPQLEKLSKPTLQQNSLIASPCATVEKLEKQRYDVCPPQLIDASFSLLVASCR